jgi:hypothetical protein
VRPEAVLPDRALCFPTFNHFLIVNKTSLSLSLSLSQISLSLSLRSPIRKREPDRDDRACATKVLLPQPFTYQCVLNPMFQAGRIAAPIPAPWPQMPVCVCVWERVCVCVSAYITSSPRACAHVRAHSRGTKKKTHRAIILKKFCHFWY